MFVIKFKRTQIFAERQLLIAKITRQRGRADPDLWTANTDFF